MPVRLCAPPVLPPCAARDGRALSLALLPPCKGDADDGYDNFDDGVNDYADGYGALLHPRRRLLLSLCVPRRGAATEQRRSCFWKLESACVHPSGEDAGGFFK